MIASSSAPQPSTSERTSGAAGFWPTACASSASSACGARWASGWTSRTVMASARSARSLSALEERTPMAFDCTLAATERAASSALGWRSATSCIARATASQASGPPRSAKAVASALQRGSPCATWSGSDTAKAATCEASESDQAPVSTVCTEVEASPATTGRSTAAITASRCARSAGSPLGPTLPSAAKARRRSSVAPSCASSDPSAACTAGSAPASLPIARAASDHTRKRGCSRPATRASAATPAVSGGSARASWSCCASAASRRIERSVSRGASRRASRSRHTAGATKGSRASAGT